MSNFTSVNGHAKAHTKAYRTIIAEQAIPAATAAPKAAPKVGATESTSWFAGVGNWLAGAATAVVSFIKKVGRWIGHATVAVVFVPAKKVGLFLGHNFVVVGRFIKSGFFMTVHAAGKVAGALRVAFFATMRVTGRVVLFVIRVFFAVFAGIVAIPLAFVGTIRRVMTGDPKFKNSLITA